MIDAHDGAAGASMCVVRWGPLSPEKVSYPQVADAVDFVSVVELALPCSLDTMARNIRVLAKVSRSDQRITNDALAVVGGGGGSASAATAMYNSVGSGITTKEGR